MNFYFIIGELGVDFNSQIMDKHLQRMKCVISPIVYDQ